MAQPNIHTAPCPGCGKEMEFTLWQSINTEVENAREKIISGELFDFCCPQCGYSARVQYPMLFSDLENNAWIWFYPEEELEGIMPIIEAAKAKGVLCRVVHTQEALSEKAAMFKLGLDDRIVELMKLAAAAQVQEIMSGCELGPIIFALNKEQQPCFLFKVDGRTNFMDMSLEEYEEFKRIFGVLLEADDSLVVDGRWVQNFMGGGEAPEAEG